MIRILIVDDDHNALQALDEILTAEGYEVKLASSAPEALRVAAEFRPHLLLTDLGLRGIDGFELIARTRRLEPPPAPVVMSAFERPRHCEATFVEKPIDLDRLLQTLAATAAAA